jgi:hypothetical protein
VRYFSIPEMRALQALRAALAVGGMPALEKRTPEDEARIGLFRLTEEALYLMAQFKRRIEAGERCRLVEREHAREPGRLLFELAIELTEVGP